MKAVDSADWNAVYDKARADGMDERAAEAWATGVVLASGRDDARDYLDRLREETE